MVNGKANTIASGRNHKTRQVLQRFVASLFPGFFFSSSHCPPFLFRRYLAEMANTDSLIFTRQAPNIQDKQYRESLASFQGLHALSAQDSLKMSKSELKQRFEEQRAKV